MRSILIYTFRTFPWKEELKTISNDIVILNHFKLDLPIIEERLKNNHYDLTLGIAKGYKKSVVETKCVNQFNSGVIIKNGKTEYLLDNLNIEDININDRYTKTFCNWGMYMVSKIIEENNIDAKHSFVHILRKDLRKLNEI